MFWDNTLFYDPYEMQVARQRRLAEQRRREAAYRQQRERELYKRALYEKYLREQAYEQALQRQEALKRQRVVAEQRRPETESATGRATRRIPVNKDTRREKLLAKANTMATRIQSLYRGHMVRRTKPLEAWRRLVVINSTVDSLVNKMDTVLDVGSPYHVEQGKLSPDVFQLEEELTQALLKTDSIKGAAVRPHRKATVKRLMKALDKVEAFRDSFHTALARWKDEHSDDLELDDVEEEEEVEEVPVEEEDEQDEQDEQEGDETQVDVDELVLKKTHRAWQTQEDIHAGDQSPRDEDMESLGLADAEELMQLDDEWPALC